MRYAPSGSEVDVESITALEHLLKRERVPIGAVDSACIFMHDARNFMQEL